MLMKLKFQKMFCKLNLMMLIYDHMHAGGLARLRWPEGDIMHMLVSAVVTSF